MNAIKTVIGLFLCLPGLLFGAVSAAYYNEEGLLCWPYQYPVPGEACYHWEQGEPDFFYSTDETGHQIVIDLKKGVRLKILSEGNTAYADVIILDQWRLYQKIKLTVPFDRIFQTPPDILLHAFDDYVRWNEVLPTADKNAFRNFNEVLLKIRSRLPIMESINRTSGEAFGGFASEGFAKWVMDGFYQPKTGHEIPYALLTDHPIEKRGGRLVLQLKEGRESFFGLDWVRNLALALAKLGFRGAQYGDNDVNYLPEFEYLGNTGYAVKSLRRILYLLAVRQPNFFFMGSLNERVDGQYNYVRYQGAVLFFPRINLQGELEVAVFENGKEYGLESFIQANSEKRVQLVSADGQTVFEPTRYAPLSVLRR